MARTAGVTRAPVAAVPDASAGAVRAVRKDAQRNRDALLAAAAEEFAERGADASLEQIARRAGVGIGTLYRHFPNRDVLIEAVYRREVAAMCDRVPGLLAEHEPLDALRTWLEEFVRFLDLKKGMKSWLNSALGPDSEVATESHRRTSEAFDTVVAAAVESGAIRADAHADDLKRALLGICMAGDGSAAGQGCSARLVDLLVDGLRYRASG